MGKFPDKTDSIGHKKWHIANHHFPDCCVESSEQFIFSKDIRFGKQIHQGGFTYVGITYQGNPYKFIPSFSLGFILLFYLNEVFLKFFILYFTIRRSVSISCSPGPLIPIPRAVFRGVSIIRAALAAGTEAVQVRPEP